MHWKTERRTAGLDAAWRRAVLMTFRLLWEDVLLSRERVKCLREQRHSVG